MPPGRPRNSLSREERRRKRSYAIHKRCDGLTLREDHEKGELEAVVQYFIAEQIDDDYDDSSEEEEDFDMLVEVLLPPLAALTEFRDTDADLLHPFDLTADNVSEAWCLQHTRFSQEQLNNLKTWLRLPDMMRLENGCKVSGEAAFILYCQFLARPIVETDLETHWGRHYSIVSRTLTLFAHWLYDTHSWRIRDNLDFWTPYFAEWNAAIRTKSINCTGSDLPQRCLNVSLFYDASFHATTEPGDPELAARCYNGYEKSTGLKIAHAVGPNGQTVFADDVYGGAHNDQFILAQGGFARKLHTVQVARNFPTLFDAYTDSGYESLRRIVATYSARHGPLANWQILENSAMKPWRTTNEWFFGFNKQQFKRTSTKSKMKIMERPIALDITNS